MEPINFASLDSFNGGGGFSSQSSIGGDSKASHDESKIFVGGLAPITSEVSLSNFFLQFGQVIDCIVMRNEDQRSKGFGFVTMASKDQLASALNSLPHTIDGKMVDSKAAIPRSANRASRPSTLSAARDINSSRLYLVGVTPEHTESEISDYFGSFGNVTKVDIVKDRETGAPRGFAFVHFGDHESVEKCLMQSSHTIGNSQCSVRKAVNKENMGANYQQYQSGYIARSPRTRGAFRNQPYAIGRNMGYNNQSYGAPAGGAYPIGVYPHINPAMQQYQSAYPGYGGSPDGYNSTPAGGFNAPQTWPANGQAYGMQNVTPMQPISSWGSGGSNVPDIKHGRGGYTRGQSGNPSSSANQSKNFNSNQYY